MTFHLNSVCIISALGTSTRCLSDPRQHTYDRAHRYTFTLSVPCETFLGHESAMLFHITDASNCATSEGHSFLNLDCTTGYSPLDIVDRNVNDVLILCKDHTIPSNHDVFLSLRILLLLKYFIPIHIGRISQVS